MGALMIAACGEATAPRLLLDVRMDLIPRVEVTGLRAEIEGVPGSTRETLADGRDWLLGARVGSWDAEGDVTLEVSALRGETVVASRRVATRVEGPTGVTVVFTRDCRGVQCPDAPESSAVACLGGRCVDESCVRGDEEACGAPACGVDADCAATSPCATPRCVDGTCLLDVGEAGSGTCGAEERCAPEIGCVASFEATQAWTLEAEPCVAAQATHATVELYDDGALVLESELGAEVRLGPQSVMRTTAGVAGWRIVARLYGPADLLLGRLEASGAYVPGASRTHALVFQQACLGVICGEERTCRDARCDLDTETPHPPAIALEVCPELAFVDGEAGVDSADCTDLAAPCRRLRHALDVHGTASGGPLVFIRGGVRYPLASFEGTTVRVGGTPGSPLVIRAWPDSGVPVFDAQGATPRALGTDASHIVFDGLALTGAENHGLSINGTVSRNIVAYRLDIYGNGAGESPFDTRAGIHVNNGGELRIEESRIHDNRHPTEEVRGVYAIDGNFGTSGDQVFEMRNCEVFDNGGERSQGIFAGIRDLRLEGNRIYGHRINLNVFGGLAPFVDARIAGNQICGATTDNVHIDVPGSFEGNLIARAPECGLLVRTGNAVAVRDNVFLSNGVGLRSESDELSEERNLFFGNDVDAEGVMLSASSVLRDPELRERGPCDYVLAEPPPDEINVIGGPALQPR